MALKTCIFSLALGTLLIGSNALADDTQLQAPQYDATQVEAQGLRGEQTYSWGNDNGGYRRYDQGPAQDRAPDGRYYHRTPQPPAPRYQQGSYQLKLVQQWVAGRYEQTWVPQSCSYRPRWGGSQCTGGYYERQWIEGHYETTEQWVWVSHGNRGSGWGRPGGYGRG